MPTAGEVLIGLGIFFFILWVPLVGEFLMRTLRDHREQSCDRARLDSRQK
jgi:hypothetical protein